MIRVVWKDSNAQTEFKPVKYRKFIVTGSALGWTTNIPNDKNIYKNNFCAQNAIDAYYGDYGQRGTEKRKAYGIQIIGTIDKGWCD